MTRRWTLPLLAALLLAGLALASPLAERMVDVATDPEADPLDVVAAVTVTPVSWLAHPTALALAALVILMVGGLIVRPPGRRLEGLALAPAVGAGTALPLLLLGDGLVVRRGAWLLMTAAFLLLWRLMVLLSAEKGPARRLLVPALFGLALLYLWEVLVRGFDVPAILLPPPSAIAAALASSAAVLAGDFVQTVLRSALRGYAIGCAAGFALALLCDRFTLLRRGLLPYATLLSAVPMVGIAPIAIMWFGFDWPSKAAVVAVTTLFPMLVNTLAGLEQADRFELDLMRSYAASHGRTLLALRLPQALPFIFNALKINSTLALISAIVAEFFGTPIAGMGFRISTEVARMNLSTVWATIAVAALTGSAAYGALALLERAATSWHPSFREQ